MTDRPEMTLAAIYSQCIVALTETNKNASEGIVDWTTSQLCKTRKHHGVFCIYFYFFVCLLVVFLLFFIFFFDYFCFCLVHNVSWLMP